MSLAPALLQALHAHFGPQQWWQTASRFEIVAGALLVQRTTWSNAERAIDNLRDRRMLSIDAVAASNSGTLRALLRPAGFFRTKADRLRSLSRYIVSQGGFAALDRLTTQTLRQCFLDQAGVGPETADVILGYAFRRRVFVVDAYARRLFARLNAPDGSPADAALKADIEHTLGDVDSLNELHALIVAHGKQYCRANPFCRGCPLHERCRFSVAATSTGPIRCS